MPIARIPFGVGDAELGFIDRCIGPRCEYPCPCSVPIYPSAFDMGEDEIWIADIAKNRLVSFGLLGRDPSNEYVGQSILFTSDLQLVDGQPLVLVVKKEGDLLALLQGQSLTLHPLHFEGASAFSNQTIHIHSGNAYTNIFRNDGPEEVSVEIVPSRDEVWEATETRGWQVAGGWLRFGEFEPMTIPLELIRDDGTVDRKIEFRIFLKRNGQLVPRNGHISWEVEVDQAGVVHLLIFAGTFGHERTDGYWYLTVSPEGDVGEVIPLVGPGAPDDQQGRQLSLDDEGTPLAMWMTSGGIRIEDLSTVGTVMPSRN